MRTLLFVGAMTVLAGLAGCAAPPLPRPSIIISWSKPGATREQFLKDRYDCIKDARGQASQGYIGAYGGAERSAPVVSLSVFKPCMSARGYTEDPNGFSPPEGGGVQMVP